MRRAESGEIACPTLSAVPCAADANNHRQVRFSHFGNICRSPRFLHANRVRRSRGCRRHSVLAPCARRSVGRWRSPGTLSARPLFKDFSPFIFTNFAGYTDSDGGAGATPRVCLEIVKPTGDRSKADFQQPGCFEFQQVVAFLAGKDTGGEQDQRSHPGDVSIADPLGWTG